VITDSEDRSMIAELERIIQTEEAKPEAERNENLIDDCIHEIAELKGVKAEYSDEEIDKITDKLVKAAEKEKKRKRFIRHIAGIAAAFVIVTGVTACAINPALINWFMKIVRMPFGATIEQSSITYTFQGSTKSYTNIEELLRQNDLDVYYPSILPENTRLIDVEIVEENSLIIAFTFTSNDFKYTIQLHSHDFQREQDIIAEIENGSLHFDVYEEDDCLVSYANVGGDEYIIQSKDINDAIIVVGGLKKLNENS